MKQLAGVVVVLLFAAQLLAQPAPGARVPSGGERFDSVAVAKIIDEGMNHSKAMETLSWITDVCGGRLTMSPSYKKAVAWTSATMKKWGLEDVHTEGWGPFGRGWSITHFSANVLEPVVFPLLAVPKAWSPGTDGKVKGEVVFLDATTDSALNLWKGKLKGKIVLLGAPQTVKAHFAPEATRDEDSTLLAMANADPDRPRVRGGRRGDFNSAARQAAAFEGKKFNFCMDQDVAAILTPSRGDGGTIFVQSATLPTRPEDTSFATRPRAQDLKAPETLPQLAVAAEHYDRMVRILQKGEKVKLELDLDVAFTREDSAYNVIAEIPGTDLKDEIVMVGGHLDSWHGGTGATDNATGVTTAMEAMRILKTLGLKPRRTIRIGLWAAEEQGLLGSRAYVTRHFGAREGGTPNGEITYTKEGENFSVYFNNDNGTGKARGVYMQGNEAVRPIFRPWLAPLRPLGMTTLTPLNTGSTDHASFDGLNLPGFQWIQDPIEYFTRTWHSNMDVYDRVQEEDVKQASVVMAVFAYNAAMRDEKIPRKKPN
jgi:carboxypeptidase Q